MEPADSLYPIPRYNGPMNWRARFLADPSRDYAEG